MNMRTNRWCAVAWMIGLAAEPAWCQTPAPGQAGLHPILHQVLQDVRPFSARAEVVCEGAVPQDAMTLLMAFSYRDGSMRAEVDMGRIDNPLLTTEMVQTIRQIGMDRVVTIMAKEASPVYVLYPHLRSVVVTKPPEDEGGAARLSKAKTVRTKLGQEAVDGVTCDKWRFTQEREGTLLCEAVVWRDPAQKGVPRQVFVGQGPSTMKVKYREIDLQPPAKDQFRVPKGYVEYGSMEEVMKAALRRLLERAPESPERKPL